MLFPCRIWGKMVCGIKELKKTNGTKIVLLRMFLLQFSTYL